MLARMLVALVAVAVAVPARAQLQVVGSVPARNAVAAAGAAVSVTFDRPLDTATVGIGTFRVFGNRSGAVRGTYSFSNGDQTATLTPNAPFAAGEVVTVNLSHDLRGADTAALRSAGWATQFTIAVAPSSGVFQEIDRFSNRSGSQTRIYGAAATDLNGDRWVDLATVNEVSADVRVFLNLADGSGLFASMLSPEAIGLESSPNETADFDNDGLVDLCTSAADDAGVWVLLGAGDGTFASTQSILLGGEPHGIATLDVDGDADPDIVDANVGSGDLALLLNDGSGTFGSPTFFDGGVTGEYGLASADMDGDGITDLVVAGRNGEEVRTLLGNGDGTFTAAGPSQATGGLTWVVVLGDVDGDGELDAATANDGDGTVGVLLGNGDGTFAAVTTLSVGAHTPSVDLGDLDGDGDLDLVASSYGGGFWRRFANDGTGSFAFVEDIPAPSNPSCSILFDADNDGDLDMALTDEIADEVVLMENDGTGTCTPAPSPCRTPILPGKAKLQLKDRSPDDKDGLGWKWTKGEATPKTDFGNPVVTDGYALCLYEDGALFRELDLPAGQLCAGRPCWRDQEKGFAYADRDLSPHGVATAKLVAGLFAGQARVSLKAKGGGIALPLLSSLTGVLDVQLQKTGGGVCWGATFTPPFLKNDGTTLKAISDAPTVTTTSTTATTTTTLPALWSAIHAQVIAPVCSGCHGGNGGLSGLDDCNTAHANLVNVPSTELTTMDRVEPGDATTSWLMHKLDGTQGSFTAQCQAMFCGSQMPLGGALSPEVRDAIRAWIAWGAANDCP
ncbi:MAG TPA: FG-GAP-like repeat-containing protein [Candidatus Binatia bacterium]|nr:FG-GAP-like repeat-containing protein [Candidatus Binatia bacterium]